MAARVWRWSRNKSRVPLVTNAPTRPPNGPTRRGSTSRRCCAVSGFAQVDDRRAPAGNEISAKLRVSLDRGFRYLLGKKRPSGDFDKEFPVAVDALVGLAFLAGGYTERTGPAEYTAAVRSCTTALLNRQLPCGYFSDGKSRMYGHGFATLYFAELYGMSHRRENIQDALRRALRVIELSQGKDGGWDYEPHAQCGGSITGASDTSITVCQTMALRAARNLGIAVDTRVIKAARRYIEKAQNPDGGFRYRSQLNNYVLDKSAFPRSAAGVCILYSLGDYNSAAIRKSGANCSACSG